MHQLTFAPDHADSLAARLDADGFAVLPGLLDAAQCAALTALYPHAEHFRSRIVMARHNFGRGQYQYFAYPLPPLVAALRTQLYARLAPVANAWHAALRVPLRYPPTLPEFLARCHAAGQCRPTPLLLAYEEGDFNCLHQDLYGVHVFPLQVAILLAQPGIDFTGGEFVITEKRAAGQQVHVVDWQQGDALVFAVDSRPAPAARGVVKASLRHGVSKVRSGHRHTLGLIFHDAA